MFESYQEVEEHVKVGQPNVSADLDTAGVLVKRETMLVDMPLFCEDGGSGSAESPLSDLLDFDAIMNSYQDQGLEIKEEDMTA